MNNTNTAHDTKKSQLANYAINALRESAWAYAMNEGTFQIEEALQTKIDAAYDEDGFDREIEMLAKAKETLDYLCRSIYLGDIERATAPNRLMKAADRLAKIIDEESMHYNILKSWEGFCK